MSNLLQDFIVHFTEHHVDSIDTSLDSTEEKTISIRDLVRQKKTISEPELRSQVSKYFDEYVCHKNQRTLGPDIFNSNRTLSTTFIKSFEEEVGLNSIKRHPGRTVLSFLLTGGAAVGLTFLGIFLFEAINATTFFALLVGAMPFMAALGPLGAILLATAVLTIAALLVCAAVVGITAAATSKAVTVTAENGAPFSDAPSSSATHLQHLSSTESTVRPEPLPPTSTVSTVSTVSPLKSQQSAAELGSPTTASFR